MKNEFDFDPEDLEFEDFDKELEDFEDFEDEIADDIEMRTAVLSKNNMVALLCIKMANAGGAICRVDPREPNPSVQIYDDPAKALEWFTKSLQTSKKNGWQIVYDGLPLQG